MENCFSSAFLSFVRFLFTNLFDLFCNVLEKKTKVTYF